MTMSAEHEGRTYTVEGDWPARYLFLAPLYTLSIDGEARARAGGVRVNPTLESGEAVVALTSWAGLNPSARLFVGGRLIASGRVRTQNQLNPALVLFIVATIGVMFWLGPDALRRLLGR